MQVGNDEDALGWPEGGARRIEHQAFIAEVNRCSGHDA